MKTEVHIRLNPFLSSGQSVNQSRMALNSMNAHDLQASALNEHPPATFDKKKLRTLCSPRRILWEPGCSCRMWPHGIFELKHLQGVIIHHAHPDLPLVFVR